MNTDTKQEKIFHYLNQNMLRKESRMRGNSEKVGEICTSRTTVIQTIEIQLHPRLKTTLFPIIAIIQPNSIGEDS